MTVISGGKIVAFSAVQSIDNEAGQDPQGTPMQLQVSMVTTVVRPMSAPEIDKAMELINDSKFSIKDLYKKGKDFYKDNKKTLKKIGKGVMGVGEIVRGILKFIPKKEETDPMILNLAELEANVKALGEKIAENFAELKNVISEQAFFTDIVSPTSVLIRLMRDCLTDPVDDVKESFIKAYRETKPLRLQYELNEYLKKKTTNPLRLNMDSEKVKTRKTFEKWEDIYCRVMAQFMILEAFGSGLMGKTSEVNIDRIIEASSEVLDDIEKWREEYKKDQEYWADFKSFLKPYMEANAELSHEKKAEVVGARLANYLTRDAFYMVIFNEAEWQQDYSYYCPNESELITGAWNGAAKCNIFVYRSRTCYQKTTDDYKVIRNKFVSSYGRLKWRGDHTLPWIIRDELVNTHVLPSDGLIALIFERLEPKIYSFNHLEHEWHKGPGHAGQVYMDFGKWKPEGENKEYMQMIVSFP